MINQLKDPNLGEECTEKLACELGDVVNSSSFPSWFISKDTVSDLVVDVVSLVLPQRSMPKFSRSFLSVKNKIDRGSCDFQCKRSI